MKTVSSVQVSLFHLSLSLSFSLPSLSLTLFSFSHSLSAVSLFLQLVGMRGTQRVHLHKENEPQPNIFHDFEETDTKWYLNIFSTTLPISLRERMSMFDCSAKGCSLEHAHVRKRSIHSFTH